MTSLATQAAEYASAMASAYAMDVGLWAVEDSIAWSDEAIDLVYRVRDLVPLPFAKCWAETAARLMNGEY